MNHSAHLPDQKREYARFTVVMLAVTGLAVLHASWQGMALMQFLESFMGVFFMVFASFKLVNLKVFAYSFQTYEKMKDRSLVWGYVYPFVQVFFGVWYLLGGNQWLDLAVLLWSGYSAYIVWLTLRKKGDVHCACLGNVIKLPLSRISFIEDFGMTLMAAAMIFLR